MAQVKYQGSPPMSAPLTNTEAYFVGFFKVIEKLFPDFFALRNLQLLLYRPVSTADLALKSFSNCFPYKSITEVIFDDTFLNMFSYFFEIASILDIFKHFSTK